MSEHVGARNAGTKLCVDALLNATTLKSNYYLDKSNGNMGSLVSSGPPIIDTLPDELLILIFFEVLGASDSTNLHIAMLLSYVCSRWRRILLQHPLFWASITVPSVADLGRLRLPLPDLLDRSAMMPLDVCVAPKLYKSYAEKGHDHSQYFSALDYAVSRARHLHFDLGEAHLLLLHALPRPPRFTHLLDNFFRSRPDKYWLSAPWLEELTVRVAADSGKLRSARSYLLHDILSKLEAPQLRYCDVEGFCVGPSISLRTFETLTTLVLKDCFLFPSFEFGTHFVCFPNLEHLAIRSPKLEGITFLGVPTSTIQFTLSHLKMMEIQCNGNDLALVSRILHRLSVPPTAVVMLFVASDSLDFPSTRKTLKRIARHFHTSLGSVPTTQNGHYTVYDISVDANPQIDVPQSIFLQL
ncbi:uncharacterized protein STEHIDRAFT_169664 [Stereum hirsutum FP-91666 SS1]|uniref:uncharacterized protein n=1 Tax=Stereum hirsutum (strain FP-91666) TaxID=721885 RepID=UPI00044494D0|nr:uncharacterized protein STEHIDRAFT_169664 [Stereum hirsutum FP-91666 SS1]EIM84762.1 hypothetical protein STEHIDRAFT_169664 [Stereum hirsutum FP-91666 SS1]